MRFSKEVDYLIRSRQRSLTNLQQRTTRLDERKDREYEQYLVNYEKKPKQKTTFSGHGFVSLQTWITFHTSLHCSLALVIPQKAEKRAGSLTMRHKSSISRSTTIIIARAEVRWSAPSFVLQNAHSSLWNSRLRVFALLTSRNLGRCSPF